MQVYIRLVLIIKSTLQKYKYMFVEEKFLIIIIIRAEQLTKEKHR
jgi:hypothetical protein